MAASSRRASILRDAVLCTAPQDEVLRWIGLRGSEEEAMHVAHFAAGMAFAIALGVAAPATAQDSIYIPLMTYRTGSFAGSGIPIANGMHDYLAMLNERDGGIGGVRLVIEECETGYDTKKGVEC